MRTRLLCLRDVTNASGVRASVSCAAATGPVDSVVVVGIGLVDRRRAGLGGDRGRRIFVFKLGSV